MAKHEQFNRKQLKDVCERLDLFIAICANSLGQDDELDERLEGQITAFDAAKVLIEQVLSRGEIWKGGYLDNVGVVYKDQVEEFYNAQMLMKQLNV